VASECSFDCSSFVARDGERFFRYLLVICAAFQNCVFCSFAHLFVGLLILCGVVYIPVFNILKEESKLIKWWSHILSFSRTELSLL
jgi:hypothetical protein